MQAVDKQPWDPSVKALTQFPSVLDNMTKNLSWTSALGEAYHTQTSDIMSAIQAMRAEAKAAGNLKSGSQITVVQQSPQKDVGVDGYHAARLLAVTFARLLASASRNDSSSENRESALMCLSTPALAPLAFLRMVIRPLCSRNST